MVVVGNGGKYKVWVMPKFPIFGSRGYHLTLQGILICLFSFVCVSFNIRLVSFSVIEIMFKKLIFI